MRYDSEVQHHRFKYPITSSSSTSSTGSSSNTAGLIEIAPGRIGPARKDPLARDNTTSYASGSSRETAIWRSSWRILGRQLT